VKTTASTQVAAPPKVLEAFAKLRAVDLPPEGAVALENALAVAAIVQNLDADEDLVLACALYPLLANLG
jgi:hypothetical protein